MMSVHDIPLRVHELTPAEAAEWDKVDDCVTCHCRNRSGAMCVVLRTSHVPVEIKHRCAHHSPLRVIR